MMTGFEQYTEEDAASDISGGDGAGGAVARAVRTGGAALSQNGERAATGGSRANAGIYFLQQWSNLSDPAVEESLYDSAVMRQFVGIDLGCEPAPDETTVCKFRHLLEEHRLGGQMLEA